jgi:hypothetical protein
MAGLRGKKEADGVMLRVKDFTYQRYSHVAFTLLNT